MSAAFQAALRGRHGDFFRAQASLLPEAAARGLRKAGGLTRRQIQRQIKSHFGSARRGLSGAAFADTIRASYQAGGGSKKAVFPMEVRIRSKAVYRKRRSERTDLLTVYSEGATIVPTGGRKWLAFPTQNAPLKGGRGGTRYARPRDCGVKLTFLPSGGDKGVLVAGAKGARKVLYVLIRRTVRRAVIDLDAPAKTYGDRLPFYVLDHLDRLSEKLLAKYGLKR